MHFAFCRPLARTARRLAAPLLLAASALLAFAAAAQPVPRVTGWIGPAGSVSVHEVAAGRVPLAPIDLERPLPLGPGLELWLRVPVGVGDESWVLQVPTPVVDEITVHQRSRHGWSNRSAGDRVPMSLWPVAGRYPVFPVEGGAAAVLLVQVRHATALALPLRLTLVDAYHQRSLLEYLGVGVSLGAAGLLLTACLVRARRLRDRGWLVLAGVALLLVLSVASITGVAAHLWWGDAGAWVDIAPGAIALLAAGASCFVCARLTAAGARMPRLGLALRVAGVGAVPLAIAYAALPRAQGLPLLAGAVMATAALTVAASVRTLWRRDPVGAWMLAGTVPLVAAVAVSLARSLGRLQLGWWADYALVAAFLLELPMLFTALDLRSRESRGVQLRQRAADHQDPLTGLPRSKVFFARALHALQRHSAHGEPAAIGLVQIADLEGLKAARGAEAAEEAILRAVILLRGLVRDVDTVARLGEGRFGLLLERVADRGPVSELATRLVAAGLREEPGGDPPLRFHVAVVLLRDYTAPPDQLLRELSSLLTQMSPRTRRPIRFLSAETALSGRASDGLQESPASI